jgi:VanZ family protein
MLVIYAGAIWYGSTLSLGEESPFRLFGLDKLAHAGEYGILGFLATNALLSLRRGIEEGDAWQGGFLLAGLWGWIDELHQYWVPGRTTDPVDLLADILGAAAGAWLCLRILKPGAQSDDDPNNDGRSNKQ